MNQSETLYTPPIPGENQEHLAIPSERQLQGLGHLALSGEVPGGVDIKEGLGQLEEHANSGADPTNHLEHDIDAAYDEALAENKIVDAHMEAIRENEMFDAHTEALLENEVFDAHTAAIQEDKAFDAHTAANKENVEPTGNQTVVAEDPKQERIHSTLEPVSTEGLRDEANARLLEAGITEQIAPHSEITMDADGNLLIIGDIDAKVISNPSLGPPRITEYHFDKTNGKLTETNKSAGHDNVATYKPTSKKQWQTHDAVITLPPAIAKRFGIEQAIAS